MLSSNRNRSSSKVWHFAIGLLRYIVPFVILGFLFREIPVADVEAVLGQSRLAYLFLAVFIWLVSHWVVACRLKILADELGSCLSVREFFGINAAVGFYGLLLPGGNVTSFAVRLYAISKTEKNYAEMAIAVLLDRAITTLTLCLIGLAFWLISQPGISASVLLVMITVSSIMLILVAVLTGWASIPTPLRVRSAMQNMERLPFERLREAFARAKGIPRRTLIRAFGLSFLVHLVGVFTYRLIAVALGIDISFVLIGWVRSGMILATMIPVSAGGLGLREVASLLLLANISSDEAVAFSLTVFAVTILPLGLLGGMYSAAMFFRASRKQTVVR